jgi:hypothetical protein
MPGPMQFPPRTVVGSFESKRKRTLTQPKQENILVLDDGVVLITETPAAKAAIVRIERKIGKPLIVNAGSSFGRLSEFRLWEDIKRNISTVDIPSKRLITGSTSYYISESTLLCFDIYSSIQKRNKNFKTLDIANKKDSNI